MRRRSPQFAAVPASSAVMALALLAACGGDELTVLSQEQADQALLSDTVMGAGFEAGEPSEEDDDESEDTDLGCLDVLDEMDEIGEETKAAVEYTATNQTGLPSLESSVLSYATTEVVSERLDEVSTKLEGCKSVEVTNDDGTSFALDVTLSTDPVSDEADEAVTLQATGTISSQEQEFPFGVWMTSVRIDNHVTVLVYTDIPDDVDQSRADFEAYAVAATERLAAVVAGEKPTEDPILGDSD